MKTNTGTGYLTIKEVASMMGVCPEAVRVWVKRGLMPSSRAGRTILIAQADLASVRGGLGAYLAYLVKDLLDSLLAGDTEALGVLRDRLGAILNLRSTRR